MCLQHGVVVVVARVLNVVVIGVPFALEIEEHATKAVC